MEKVRDFIVIGAAQAGLSMAYYLKKLGRDYLLVDKEEQIGASWINRWDSLTLFTPSEFNNLPGMDFPAPKGHYPSKEEVAEYFKMYAEKFKIPIQFNTFISEISRENGNFLLKSPQGNLRARNVIIGTGPFHIPYTPPFAEKLDEQIFQVHSNYYKNPQQLKEGKTMVVGGGDSGFQILDEVSETGMQVYFSGATDVKTLPQEILGKTLWWWFTKTGFLSFSRDSWLGKKISKSRQPIIGTDVKAILKRENVTPVGKTKNAEGKLIFTEKKKLNDINNIIWATGYRPNFGWIEGLELNKDGYPKHHRGISNLDNLYFIGLPWLHTRGSATLGGIKKDAEYLAKHISEN
ncbi:NAD(P)/FAD-dependent oxidoreductase [Zunongwangia sp. F363]|uniref:NAD(P)/FAD-dependent oxidoreductase n=1 Tax=Autumnicola tepida TaxID=3075595 RepID=A0ABU3CBZ8_9FLAO|nr:NAD(P)/FAD-dependent oxidoreductase [Zunongwangia sp. F363]MDT0643864.1 NAD(P)/FAD-dependent oxidoreductase [Zunongwangia sp. F363]